MDGITDSLGHEFEEALGVGDGQGGLACYSPWGPKELDTTEQLNWNRGEQRKEQKYLNKKLLISAQSSFLVLPTQSTSWVH